MVQQATQLPLSGLWSFEKEDSVSWTFTILGLKPAVCSRWMPPGLSYSADEWAVACMGASLAIVCVCFFIEMIIAINGLQTEGDHFLA